MESKNKTIISIPGLGGHKSVFDKYESQFQDFDFYRVDLIDIKKTTQDVLDIIDKKNNIVLLCNCYGLQIALRVLPLKGDKIKGLIVVEPYFGEFLFWRKPAIFINHLILEFLDILDFIGFRRKTFPNMDYSTVEKFPLFFQPFFDMWHQDLTKYFLKIDDVLTFEVPEKVELKTLFILSPKGFIQDQNKREVLKKAFVNSEIVELEEKSHNIVTIARMKISELVKNWLNKNNI